MKILALLSLISVSLSVSAFAAKKDYLKLIGDDLSVITNAFEYQQEVCVIKVVDAANGFDLTVQEAGKAAIEISFTADTQIKLVKEEKDFDGSFIRKYQIPGRGKIDFSHVDDAYDHFNVAIDGLTASCELDY